APAARAARRGDVAAVQLHVDAPHPARLGIEEPVTARGIPAAQRDRAPYAQDEHEAERRDRGEGERPMQRYPQRRRRPISTRPASSTSPGSTTTPATKI